jgi:hypothetical protein
MNAAEIKTGPSHATCERPERKPKGKPLLMTKHNSKRAQSYAIRIVAVLHLALALFVLLALTHMDNTQVQAAAAYMWAFLALLLAVGTFTSDKEAK